MAFACSDCVMIYFMQLVNNTAYPGRRGADWRQGERRKSADRSSKATCQKKGQKCQCKIGGRSGPDYYSEDREATDRRRRPPVKPKIGVEPLMCTGGLNVSSNPIIDDVAMGIGTRKSVDNYQREECSSQKSGKNE